MTWISLRTSQKPYSPERPLSRLQPRLTLSARSSIQRRKDAAAVADSIFQIDNHPRKSVFGNRQVPPRFSSAAWDLAYSGQSSVDQPLTDLQTIEMLVLNQPTAAIKHTKERRA